MRGGYDFGTVTRSIVQEHKKETGPSNTKKHLKLQNATSKVIEEQRKTKRIMCRSGALKHDDISHPVDEKLLKVIRYKFPAKRTIQSAVKPGKQNCLHIYKKYIEKLKELSVDTLYKEGEKNKTNQELMKIYEAKSEAKSISFQKHRNKLDTLAIQYMKQIYQTLETNTAVTNNKTLVVERNQPIHSDMLYKYCLSYNRVKKTNANANAQPRK